MLLPGHLTSGQGAAERFFAWLKGGVPEAGPALRAPAQRLHRPGLLGLLPHPLEAF